MQMLPEEASSKEMARLRDHLANERTFLAWMRTSIGIMAFGFVLERFAFFLKKVSFLLENTELAVPKPITPIIKSTMEEGYSSAIGIFLVALGAILAMLAFIKFKKIEKQIESDTFQTFIYNDIILITAVVAIGIVLVIYLSASF